LIRNAFGFGNSFANFQCMMIKTILTIFVLAAQVLAAQNVVTIPAGAWVSVRVNQQLSSECN